MGIVRAVSRTTIAALLAASVATAPAVAGVRPSSAVPVATVGTAATAQDYDNDGGFGLAWPAYVVIGITIAVALYIALHNSHDDFSLSRG